MNIFILSRSVSPPLHFRTNAKYHCDKHVVKMIAESVQMLATAYHHSLPLASELDAPPCKPLSGGFLKHPCVQWTLAHHNNINYLCRLALALCDEHQYRYPLNPEHTYFPWLRQLAKHLDSLGFHANSSLPTHFAVAIKDPAKRSTSCLHQDAVSIYRNYYVDDKAAFATWKNRESPEWWPFS